MIQAALIALIAFLAYMGDALGYSQYDRPLCTGVLVGIALNDVQQGLMVGASLELVYMGTLTIGGAFPPDIYTGGSWVRHLQLPQAPVSRGQLHFPFQSQPLLCL